MVNGVKGGGGSRKRNHKRKHNQGGSRKRKRSQSQKRKRLKNELEVARICKGWDSSTMHAFVYNARTGAIVDNRPMKTNPIRFITEEDRLQGARWLKKVLCTWGGCIDVQVKHVWIVTTSKKRKRE